jgi:hypothetical protein
MANRSQLGSNDDHDDDDANDDNESEHCSSGAGIGRSTQRPLQWYCCPSRCCILTETDNPYDSVR